MYRGEWPAEPHRYLLLPLNPTDLQLSLAFLISQQWIFVLDRRVRLRWILAVYVINIAVPMHVCWWIKYGSWLVAARVIFSRYICLGVELNKTAVYYTIGHRWETKLLHIRLCSIGQCGFLCLWSLEVVITSYCFKGTDHKYNDREITYLFDFMFFVDHLNLINPRLRYNYNNSWRVHKIQQFIRRRS